jgi:hypothetical protein
MPHTKKETYLLYRSAFAPKPVKLVIVAESPPDSGLYFYNPLGRVKEPLFYAMMRQLRFQPTTKVEGLREFQRRGWLLMDATYEPVNGSHNKKQRDAVILRDYPLLRADLETLLPDKSTPVVLVKVNVCRLLEPKLTADGFNVLNKGVAIYFPSTGGQTKFHEQFAEMLMRCDVTR